MVACSFDRAVNRRYIDTMSFFVQSALFQRRFVSFAVAAVLVVSPAAAQAPPPSQPPVVESPSTPPAQQRSAPAPKNPLDRVPRTAEDKARLLSDLYAHLATAEDEAQAKKTSERIERLWLLSGSETVNLLMERAAKAMAEKKFEKAEKLLDQVIGLAPDYAEGFNRRAYINFSQNKYEQAVGDLRRVLALEPNHYKALEGLAQIWRDTGNKPGALRVMRQLIDVNPFFPGAKGVIDELKNEVEGRGI